jgi:hypothetical protein
MAINPIGNPAAYLYAQQNGLNDDFMYNAAMAQAASQNPAFTGGFNMPAQVTADTFEKQGSGLAAGAKIGLVGGLGAAAGAYYFGGDKLGINPYIDGKYQDDFLKILEEEGAVTKEVERLTNEEIKKLCNGKALNKYQLDAIKELADNGQLPTGVTLPKGYKLSQEQAKKLLEDIKKINTEELVKIAEQSVTLDGSKAYLKELNEIKSKLGALPENITKEELAKHIQENAKLYGITGADEAAIKAAAETKAGRGLSELISENAAKIKIQDGVVSDIRTNLTSKVTEHFDTAKNVVKEGAPENIAKAVKNFKFKKAGKIGAIVGGIGLAIGWLFG